MLALYRSGRQADALATFQRARDLLVEDLGLEPSPALAAMERAILLQDPALDAVSAAEGVAAPLPSLLTPTIGRAAEIDETAAKVLHNRLITITGPGGAGKTRLAVEIGRRSEASFPDGVWFVDLSTTRDRPAFLADLSRAVGAPPAEDPLAGLASHLAKWRALIILDNLERVIDAAIDLANPMRRTSEIHVLVTSRVALRVAGEQLVQLGSLEPDEASALFRARVAAVTGVGITDAVVNGIVDRVDGLPLAIELAAASCRALAAADVLERLTRRLPLPTGPRDLPARHQTLPAIVSWSTELLAPLERELPENLSAFRAPFTIHAATGLLDDDREVPARLATLVGASLVVHDDDGYRILGTIREIVREAVDPARRAAIDDRHASWMATTAAVAVDGLHAPSRTSCGDGSARPTCWSATAARNSWLCWKARPRPTRSRSLSRFARPWRLRRSTRVTVP